ncbi:hypothetical protein JTE90_005746 [Oedothorax gibbosus]|uniref:Uncharacterized protein n=1 Tax=Oedothorax gibbosus TaxID=931172 RepID=A0AAV6UTA4_9ARAC|nr:hypothetical protein JTE90_005746 [Oedothorax gibbosus]
MTTLMVCYFLTPYQLYHLSVFIGPRDYHRRPSSASPANAPIVGPSVTPSAAAAIAAVKERSPVTVTATSSSKGADP